ncbi:MAG: DUF1559 domain-containing protein [Planctomycetaceae bacterium]|nr:DUF1559 domain-containing protein [Planctomycetaceae bacterium]
MTTGPPKFHWRLAAIVVCVLAIALTWWASRPPVRAMREVSRPVQCRNNLMQIGLALRNYHDEWGSFPPAYVTDADGLRLHGWRTLLLPYLDQAPLYNAYRFDEPWDGKNNATLQDHSLPVLICPSNSHSVQGQTSYVAVVGTGTAWPGSTPAKLEEDFPDGPSNTILVVEIEDSGIHWMKPRDLNFEEMNFALNDSEDRSISARHKEKGRWPWSGTSAWVNVLFADGSVKRIRVDTPSETIRALLTANGREAITVPP